MGRSLCITRFIVQVIHGTGASKLAPIPIAWTRLSIDDLIKKLSRENKYGSFLRFDLEKLSGGDEALKDFFLNKQGHFQSPRIGSIGFNRSVTTTGRKGEAEKIHLQTAVIRALNEILNQQRKEAKIRPRDGGELVY
ncbi:hypothetical protein HDU98_005048 [Podochytrium sp. JEL0797]|nr:hypothetical protein HDU98_005048 [Podochytrium sp. JEL0797]